MLDTSVVVAALRSSRGASRLLLEAVLDGAAQVLISVPLVLEYEAVLTRREQLVAIGLSSAEIGQILDALVSVAMHVQFRFLWRPQLNDPADEMVLETAVNGQADRIVTFNARDFAAADGFGIAVVTPQQALKEISRRKRGASERNVKRN